MDERRRLPSRRAFLVGAGALLAAGCSNTDDSDPADAAAVTGPSASPTTTGPPTGDEGGSAPEPITTAMFAALPICTLLPAAPAGPFPSRERLERRDITEGYPGHPLRLGIRVVDRGCGPVPGAEVEIWHADASGDYSSFTDRGTGKDEGAGTTFCRGFQTADTDGILELQTIYPGWYRGRAVHIHVTARLGDRDVLTTQLYFDETYTATVHATGEYARFGPPDTSWADDGLIGDPATDGTGITLAAAPTSLGDGTLGLVNLGVPV